MKLHTGGQEVEIVGGGSSSTFSIKSSPKAFQILSSGLYSNKPMAVIRELSANAYDAHTMVGREKTPFEIKLPNRLDTQFWVKDYGPGLSHDQVMKLYTTYFESLKTESNDFIGGLGLGSKSPFSYTDSFTVESRQGGQKRVYTAYIGQDGSPQMQQLGDAMPTDEKDGLTVGFPVNPSDFRAFEHEARKLLPFFDPMPTVLGVGKVEPRTPLRKGPGVEVYNQIPGWADSQYGERKVFARMGQIIYPIDWNAAGLEEDTLVVEFFKHMRHHMVVNIPIGKVDVAASREQLQYDKQSRDALRQAAYDIAATIGDVLEQEASKIVKKKSTFEAQIELAKMQKEWGLDFSRVVTLLESKTGKKFPNLKNIEDIALPTQEYKTFEVYHIARGDSTGSMLVKGSYKDRNQNTRVCKIRGDNPALIAECDSRSHAASAKILLGQAPTEKYMKGLQHEVAYVIVPKSAKVLGSKEYEAEKATFLKALGDPTLRKTSEVTHLLPTRAQGGGSVTKEQVEVYDIDVYNGYDKKRVRSTKKLMDVSDIKLWYPIDATSFDLNFAMRKDKDGKDIYEIMQSHSLRGFKQLFDRLKTIAKQAGVDIPLAKETAAVSARGYAKMDPSKRVDRVMKAWLDDPKVQAILHSANVRISFEDYTGYRTRDAAQRMLTMVKSNSAFFSKLGPGWQTLASCNEEEPLVKSIEKVVPAAIRKDWSIENKKQRVIHGEKTFNRLLGASPLLAAAITSLGTLDNNAANTAVTSAIKDYVANNNIDVPLNFM